MFLKAILNEERGSSYIQIILASTAIAGLALVGIKMANEQKKLAINVSRQYLINYLHQEVSYFLSQDQNCQSSLVGQGFRNMTLEGLRSSNDSNELFYSTHTKIEKKEVVFFEEPIFIKSYKLLEDDSQEKAQLQVSYAYDDIEVDKFIPLKLSLNEENRVDDCSVLINQSVNDGNGPWRKDKDSIRTNYQNLLLGDKSLRGEGVVLSEGIHFFEESDLTKCDDSSRGVIRNIKDKGLRFCKENIWYPLGQQNLKTQVQTRYLAGVTKAGSQKVVSTKHRHCFITKLKKDLESDGCQIQRLTSDVMSPFEITAFTSGAATSMECEVSCVD